MRKHFNKVIIIFILLSLLSGLTACNQKTKSSNPEKGKGLSTIKPELVGMNADIAEIMGQIDLIPYYKKQISEKKKKEKESSQGGGSNKSKPGSQQGQQQGSQQQGSQQQGSQQGNQSKKAKPKPVTIKDTILLEILEKEIPYTVEELKKKQIPEDIVFSWHDINTRIKKLHGKWDDIKPKLEKINVPKDSLNGFENTLNSLTMSSSSNDIKKSLINANKLTSYIPQFFVGTSEKVSSAAINIKYNLRQIVLDTANNKSKDIDKKLKEIKKDSDILTAKLIKEKSTELSSKIKSSVASFENSLSTKDLVVIKTKAAIIMQNISSAKKILD